MVQVSERELWFVPKVAAAAIAALFSGLTTFALVTDAVQRRRKAGKERRSGRSGIYSGTVWHARLKPTAHRFTYPIFYCLVDLDELDIAFPWYIWPVVSARLPALGWLRRRDHLKGEVGKRGREQTRIHSLAKRVRDMVEDATGARPEGRVQLLTHLAYLGYCFNPVSFYYCLDESEERIETVVAEVSNTPWGEMHCYVLNPKARGVELIPEDQKGLVRYRFEKDFHVSPFMSMKHTYDWKFSPPSTKAGSSLTAQTTLLERESGKVFFDVKLDVRRRDFSAAGLCWHMTVYPAYTLWVQLLIHYEAFRLWWKKVPFFPHPEGTETAASRLVSAIMTPLYNMQEAWDARSARDQTGSRGKTKGA